MEKVEVGAAVYYKAPTAYAVRKSTVVEVVEHPFRHHGSILHRFVYVLANGERLRWLDAYATREDAEADLIKELKVSLNFKNGELLNLQHEIAYDDEALKRLEKRLPKRNLPQG